MKKYLLAAIFPVFMLAGSTAVKVSSFAPDPKNATAAVQKALDSGARQIIFDDPGFHCEPFAGEFFRTARMRKRTSFNRMAGMKRPLKYNSPEKRESAD